MKALIYDGPYTMHLEELAVPEPGNNEVLVKISATAICGSDIHGYTGETMRRYKGMVMGHEISGTIEKLGADVKDIKIGQKIAIQPIIYCGKCETCRRGLISVCLNKEMIGINMDKVGGFSEYIVVPALNVFPFQTDVQPATAALAEPLAVGAGAVRMAEIQPEENVVIVGGGMIGQAILLMLKDKNTKNIFVIDQNERRLARAEELGAIKINFTRVDPAEFIFKETNNLGADVVIEAVGVSNSVKVSHSLCKTGGKIIWVGNSQKMIDMDMQDIVTKMKSIQGVYCYNNEDFKNAVDFIDNNGGLVSSFVEDRAILDNASELFAQLAGGQKDCFRGVVEIGERC